MEKSDEIINNQTKQFLQLYTKNSTFFTLFSTKNKFNENIISCLICLYQQARMQGGAYGPSLLASTWWGGGVNGGNKGNFVEKDFFVLC